jgi:hypothetical protein
MLFAEDPIIQPERVFDQPAARPEVFPLAGGVTTVALVFTRGRRSENSTSSPLPEVRALRSLPPRSERSERSREGRQRPYRVLARSSTQLLPMRSNGGSTMLTTFLTVFKRDNKRAPSVVAECPSGRSGTLRTTRQGKPPAESGTSASTSDARSDRETGSPALNKRGAGSPRVREGRVVHKRLVQ